MVLPSFTSTTTRLFFQNLIFFRSLCIILVILFYGLLSLTSLNGLGLKFKEIRPLIYALAEANISNYEIETQLIK